MFQKLKLRKAFKKIRDLKDKLELNMSKDTDLIQWHVAMDHLLTVQEIPEYQQSVEEAKNIYTDYLHKHFPKHSFLVEY
jgi:hypothetical protein